MVVVAVVVVVVAKGSDLSKIWGHVPLVAQREAAARRGGVERFLQALVLGAIAFGVGVRVAVIGHHNVVIAGLSVSTTYASKQR